ncbi:MAG TPA: hypothetical protein VFM14_15605 [Gemmatimonadales bacterium]|nr:hypothetical protein [Gemmatimonadales bacterium]
MHAALVTMVNAAAAEAVFQLTFTDLDVQGGWPAGIAPFASLGLVDVAFAPKPALARWDAVVSRPRQ